MRTSLILSILSALLVALATACSPAPCRNCAAINEPCASTQECRIGLYCSELHENSCQAPPNIDGPPVCTPDARRCEGEKALVCDGSGLEWLLAERCVYACRNGWCDVAPDAGP